MPETETLDKETLKALSTDTRQEIVKKLARRPYTASELSKLLDKHVTTIAEHLSVLERSGVVRKKESSNKWVYYALTDKGEKFFKPYFSWILMFSLSIVAFVAGFYEVLYVRFGATMINAGETASSMLTTGAPAPVAIVTYNTNLILGVTGIAAGIALMALVVFTRRRTRDKQMHTLLEQVRFLEAK